MKLPCTLAICCASAALLAAPGAYAQAYNQHSTVGERNTDTTGSKTTEQTLGMQSQFCHANQIIGTQAKDQQGQSLGKVHDVVFNAKQGQIFAAIDIGNDKYALVPWQEVNVTANGEKSGWAWWGHNKEQVTINTTKETLQSAPSISGKETQRLTDPTFVQSVYSYFHVQAPNAAMGGTSENGVSGTSSQTGTSSNSSSSQNQQNSSEPK